MEIGARLKEARETKGLSLDSLQDTTKIQKRYLRAIEQNDFEVLPGKFYTRAFIREYASAVGLDPEQVMEEHKSELPTFEDESAVQYSRVQKSKKEASQKSSGGAGLFPTILTVALIVGILFVAWVLWQNGNEAGGDGGTQPSDSSDEINVPEDSESGTNSESTENTEQSEEGGSGKETEDAEEEQAQEEPEQQLEAKLTEEGSGSFPEHVYSIFGAENREVTIELTGAAYMEAQSPKGGEDLITPREYSPSDSPLTLKFDGNNELYIKTGNAPGTTVTINDQEIPFPTDRSTQKLLLQYQE